MIYCILTSIIVNMTKMAVKRREPCARRRLAIIAMFLIFWSLGKQGRDEDDREGKG